MASARVAKLANFNWEKLFSKIGSSDVVRQWGALRSQATEYLADISKYENTPSVDFDGYKKKLTFTAHGADKLKAAYAKVKAPTYSHALSAEDVERRKAMLAVLDQSVTAAKADLEVLYAQREKVVNERLHINSTMAEARDRFPDIARSSEDEISQGLYIYNKAEIREASHWVEEDWTEAACQTDGSEYAKSGKGFFFKHHMPMPIGEDAPCAVRKGASDAH